MSALWFKHDAHFHEHPKALKLRRLAGAKADSAEVGWWRIIAAAKRFGAWTFEDEDHLAHVAGRYAGFLGLYRESGLLDGLTIHNADEYQGPLSGAERVQKHRSRNEPTVTPAVTDVTPREDKSREDKSREEIPRDAADVYWQLTGKYPAGRALDWIDNLASTYGGEATIRALVKVHIANSSVNDLLSRTQDALRSEARKLDLKEREAEAARLAAKRAKPRVEEQWRAEFREAQQRYYAEKGAA